MKLIFINRQKEKDIYTAITNITIIYIYDLNINTISYVYQVHNKMKIDLQKKYTLIAEKTTGFSVGIWEEDGYAYFIQN